jgi:hypothetical protein
VLGSRNYEPHDKVTILFPKKTNKITITRLRCLLCGVAFYGVKIPRLRHNYTYRINHLSGVVRCSLIISTRLTCSLCSFAFRIIIFPVLFSYNYTRLTCSLCGFVFHGIGGCHNYNTITRFAVFRPVALFTLWPRLRHRVSPSHRDWDYDCRLCLHSSNRHLTVVTKIKTLYPINTLPSWPRLRLRVSPSRRDCEIMTACFVMSRLWFYVHSAASRSMASRTHDYDMFTPIE